MKSKLLFIFFFLVGTITLNAQAYTANVDFGQHELAIREVRRNAVTGNLGWNGITGFGITFHNYFSKKLGTQIGIGLASTGVKFGGRFYYLFMDKNFSPFVSGGIMYGLGYGDTELDYEYDGSYKYSYTIGASPFAQIAVGIERISNGGFLFSANIGYAILLTDSNYEITKGNPTADELQAMDIALGSGIVIEFSIGYAFGNKKLNR